MEFDLTHWILPALLVAVWMVSWWRRTRRFRLWFALLAPPGCIGGVILALVWGSLDSTPAGNSCYGPCGGSAVQRWADRSDTPSAASVWLGNNAINALGVVVVLAVVTLIVEGVRWAVRKSRADRAEADRGHIRS